VLKIWWIAAFGLMLFFEGIIPFVFPRQWKDTFDRIVRFSNGQIRFFGLITVLCGLATLALAELFS
jgi:uncharacterized protein